ncbi:hypothetical protein DLAC_10392 [Tieghemostelium lacteum]|uniref:Uncharacterized protein n=1 Tax=Tieghemostelium lacteum TaxID=361077 RepID=A0A151Z5D1_TIELA|nr:hypothetical protein DLAC_10392 [Tieghemostelium lacteum]|eukprot:KYQ89151.1 hypothetical protein DLAC_10392 [Tieghemostelium lacteum]
MDGVVKQSNTEKENIKLVESTKNQQLLQEMLSSFNSINIIQMSISNVNQLDYHNNNYNSDDRSKSRDEVSKFREELSKRDEFKVLKERNMDLAAFIYSEADIDVYNDTMKFQDFNMFVTIQKLKFNKYQM